MKPDIKSRNLLGGLPVETGNSDNLAIVLATYFEHHLDHPEERDMDDELGWTKWALKKTDEALDILAEELRKNPIPPQPSNRALLAALKGQLTEYMHARTRIENAMEEMQEKRGTYDVFNELHDAFEKMDAAIQAQVAALAAAEPKAEGKG